MDLINEQNSWHNLSSTFLSPFSNFLINLLSNLWLNFSNVSCKESQKSLSSGVDDIDFMKSNCMNNFLSLLEFSFWALHKAGLWSNVVVVSRAGERAT
jgi:hypothetical protein